MGFYLCKHQAYTSQIAAMTMMALALGEDTLSNRSRREEIIDDLFNLPGSFFFSFFFLFVCVCVCVLKESISLFAA